MRRLVITRSQRRGVVGLAAVILLAAVVVLNVDGGDSLTNAGGGSAGGSGLPDDEFALFEGGETSFAEFEGKPLVVNFWASWCPACVNELPELQQVHERLGDDVTFLGIAQSDRRSAADALAAQVGLTYTLADDPDGDLFRSLDLIAMPTTLFISADGELQDIFAGQLNERLLVERIDRLRGRP
jgi:thiol-disulfide isomerase/thioredoxin